MPNPKCPHCGTEFSDDQIWHEHSGCEFPTERDGDTSDFDCPFCGERLYVTLETTPHWSFTDEDGNDLD